MLPVRDHGMKKNPTTSGPLNYRDLIAGARRQAEAARDLPNRSDQIAAVRASLADSDSRKSGFPDAESLPKELLDHYRVTGEVYRGGQGFVCVAMQKSTGRRVAIKVMRDGPFSGREDCLRFEREARILAQLDHPNIVGIIDSGLSRGLFYFVMDYVEGEPLSHWMSARAEAIARSHAERLSTRRSFRFKSTSQRGQTEIDESLALFLKVADAIHAAHLRGVIHRDLKPGNIQVDPAGEPHILDFGMAKVDDVTSGGSSAGAMTQTGRFFGSLPWASPEQAAGRLTEVDVRSDVYALGVILYQMLAGDFPYPVEGGLARVLNVIQNVEPTRVRSRNACVDDELETIVLKCLQKDPARRYQSAGELAEDLRRHQAGEPIAAKRDALPYLIKKAARRYAMPVGIAATFMLLVVTGLFVSIWLWRAAAAAEKTAWDERDKTLASERKQARERARAETEAANARSVNSLLQQLLTGSSPYHNANREVTARELLEEAARKLEVDGAERPEVEARVRITLGAAFFGIGQPTKAGQLLASALKMWTDLRGAESPEIAETLGLLSLVKLVEGDQKECESLARRCLEMSRRLYPGDHVQKAVALECQAKALVNLGRSGEGEPLIREAVDMYRKLEGSDSLRVSRALVNLARVLMHDRNRVKETLEALEEALAINRRHYGGKHSDLVQNLTALANMLSMNEKDTEAESYYLESITLGREVFGNDHPDVLAPQANLASLYMRMEKLEEAEALMRAVHEGERRVFGSDSPRVISHHHSLGELRVRMKDIKGAEAEYRAAVEESRRLNAKEHTPACMARSNLALVLVNDGRYDEAEPLLEEQLQNADVDSVLTKWCVFHAKSLQGEIRLARGQLAEAEPLLKEGAEGLLTTKLAGSRRRSRALEKLAQCYDQLNTVSPGAGYDAKAAQCRRQFEVMSAEPDIFLRK